MRSLLCCAVLAACRNVLAFSLPDQEPLPGIDARRNLPAGTNTLSAAHEAGVNRLKSHYADVQFGTDEILHRPNFVSRRNGFLTGPDGGGAVIAKAALNAVPANDPHRIVKAFLDEHAGVFGHDSSVLTNAVVKPDYVTKHNGLHTTGWEQQFDGIPLFIRRYFLAVCTGSAESGTSLLVSRK